MIEPWDNEEPCEGGAGTLMLIAGIAAIAILVAIYFLI